MDAAELVEGSGEHVAVDTRRPVEPDTLRRMGYGVASSATSRIVSPPVTAMTDAPLYIAMASVSFVAAPELSRQSANFDVSTKLWRSASRLAADAAGSFAHLSPMSCPTCAPAIFVMKSSPETYEAPSTMTTCPVAPSTVSDPANV